MHVAKSENQCSMKTRILFRHLFVSTVLATLMGMGQIIFAAPGRPRAVVRSSFWQVAKHLDMGGSHFSYQSHEQVQGMIDQVLAQFPEKLNENAPQELNTARLVLEVLQKLKNDFGLGEISGTGASSFAIGKDLVRNKMFTHHYPGQDKGLMWRLFGTKPHEQEVLDLLPVETVAMVQTDLDLVLAVNWVEAFLKRHHPQQAQMVAQMKLQLNQQVGLERLLASYGGEVGMAVMMDLNTKLILPPEAPKLPVPGILLTIKVKDDALYKFIAAMLGTAAPTRIQKVQGVDMTVMDLPANDLKSLTAMGIRAQPALFQVDGYLMLASDLTLAGRVLSTRSGNWPGLTTSPEFARFANGLDLTGNQIRFVSPRVQDLAKETMDALRRTVFKVSATTGLVGFTLLELLVVVALASPAVGNSGTYKGGLTVMRIQPDGLATEGHWANGMSQSAGISPPLVVAVVGILASMLLPALAKAKARANAIKSVNNAKQLGIGLIAHAGDNDDKLPDAGKWCDATLRDVGSARVYVSPQDPMAQARTEAGQKFSSYALNAAVAGKNLADLPFDTVLVFECPLGWNGTGGLADIQRARTQPGPYGQLQNIPVTMIDGSSRQVRFSELERLNWTGRKR